MNEIRDRKRIATTIGALFITACLLAGLNVFFQVVSNHRPVEPAPPKTWEQLTPTIPACPDPLWQRITNQCRRQG